MHDPQATPPPSAEGSSGHGASSIERRALVVAGQDAVREMAVACATGRGWITEACATGTDAVYHLSSRPPAVVVYAEPVPDMPVSQLWRAAGPSLRFAVRIHAGAGPGLDHASARAGEPADAGVLAHVRTIDVLPRAEALDGALRALEALVPAAPAAVASLLDADDDALHGMVGATPVMRDLFGLIRRLAPRVRTALILGEPGTGKELLARVLHRAGPRAAGRFIALDCASLGEGAATTFGAPWCSPGEHPAWGVFQQATGGVLFLDAVGDLSATAQGRLLSALESRGFHGGSPPTPGPDVHVFAASERDLRSDVAAGRFRRDLFYHLSVVELRVPSLGERRPDIVRLAAAFLRNCARHVTHALEGFTEDAEALLTCAPWEGNVRELRSLVERVSLLAEGPLVTARDVLACLPCQRGTERDAAAADREARERAHLLAVLDDVGGNKKVAAERMGLSRRAFYRRLERLSMDDTITRRPGRRLAG